MGGCATSGFSGFDQIVKKRASFDFQCHENYVETIALNLNTFEARGCGKQAKYKVKCNQIGPCTAEKE